jgi:hypothetical protein
MTAISENPPRVRELTEEETRQVTGGMMFRMDRMERIIRLDAFLDRTDRRPRLDAFLDRRFGI